ncbi:cysteine proteinase [Basidiobolus meristosporus CBS 931.73]|uniref:Ubiquitin carboxyl-terminal hydrolase n=1 Tax=Basidiobolus meristosporus CBS 931.73 TaxID=1314790 RepID=A0A1Y1Y9X1_9FUNG|nr:cysteine proteinase [Basidiobolus meristosporus CBS 931.73]|eukprot:ORX94374.1 cysteine proteinase [Basidiobolus meristosporus CBS 931.73]
MVKKGKVKQKKAQRASKTTAGKNRKQSEPSAEPIFSDVEDASSEDETTNKPARCPHLKCIKLPKIKKTLPHLEPGDCYICKKETTLDSEIATTEDKDKKQFLCLTCCKITCSNEDNDHAHEHFEMTNKGDSLAINLKSLECWCFRCEGEIAPSSKNQVIFDVRTLVEKHLGTKASKAEKSVSEPKLSSKQKIRIVAPGLQNLGNTCFFNSLMQSISATKYLQDLWMMPLEDLKKVPHTFGPLNTSMRGMLTSMWTQKGSVVKPVEFFSMIAKKWKQFKGFHQQDSHELMRYLFDGLREEQIKSTRRGDQGTETKSVSIIDDCFGGKLVSLIVCDTCKSVSYSYEDFLDLSLPIDIDIQEPVDKKSRKEKRSRKVPKTNADDKGEEEIEEAKRESEESSNAAIPTPSAEYLAFASSLLSDRCADMKIEKFSLENCINKFTAVEELSGENSYTCESCYKYMHPESEADSDSSASPSVTEEAFLHSPGSPNSITSDQEDECSLENPLPVEDKATAENSDLAELELDNRSSQPESELLDLKDMSLNESSESMMEMDLFASSETDGNSDNEASPPVDAFGNYIEKPVTVAPQKPKKQTYVLRKAFRRYLIHTAPTVLVCHLKRFQQYGYSLFRASTRKIDDYVQFPTEIDISTFMAPRTCFPEGKSPILSQNQELIIANFNEKQPQIMYSLYAVVVHMGGLSGGHYVAYVLTDRYEDPISSEASQDDSEEPKETPTTKPAEKRWIYCSDTQVRPAPLEEVLRCQAYLLFYEKYTPAESDTC